VITHPRFFLFLLILCRGHALAGDWPAWRGPTGIGLCDDKNLPVTWSTTENVKWRVPLPEPGNSTPIISRGRIFITQAVGDRRTVMCFDRADGKLRWQQGVTSKQKEPTHATNPYCSGSPVTDGERVIASFASDGLFCFDFDGKELWRRSDLGQQIHIWGGAASPVIHGDLCFLNFGPGEGTYLLAVDRLGEARLGGRARAQRQVGGRLERHHRVDPAHHVARALVRAPVAVLVAQAARDADQPGSDSATRKICR
jgi:hypothetical protein